MPTTFTKGDLFSATGLSAVAHGCSCAGAMDSGVSAAFKKRFPGMFDDYKARCDDKRFALGDVLVWNEGDLAVYTLCIQEHWKSKAKLAAFQAALKKMVSLAELAGVARVGMPRIGAGLGGLDWLRVRRILQDTGKETKVTLVVFEQFVRQEPRTPKPEGASDGVASSRVAEPASVAAPLSAEDLADVT
ncbi:phosphatase [bacterium]|nr:MAG: phosphatase [bacterium]